MDDGAAAQGPVELEIGPARLTVVPGVGGRIGRLRVFDQDLLVRASDVGGDDTTGAGADPMVWGSFPMAPWVGRIRHGRFEHAGHHHQLALNLPPHAIHGTTFDRPWSVTRLHRDHEAAEVSLEIELGPDEDHQQQGGGWPFGGRAVQDIRLGPGGLRCRLTVHADTTAMPAEIGWHPWFVKPDHLWFEPSAMYRRDEERITVDRTVDPSEFNGPFDHCFINDRPVVLVIGDLAITVTSDADHWVLYDEPAHATCVEPQSGPPDAFNLRPRVLQPGESLERRMLVSWSTTP